MDTRLISASHPDAIPSALEVLRGGGLVAFPTDTVYGLAALVGDSAGIDRLYEAKSRAANKAIAVLIADLDQLARLTPGLAPAARRLAERFWPGALTLVLPKRLNLPANLSPLPTVGVRMPDHAFARALIRAAGPLATTSANVSGEANPLASRDVLEQLGGRIELILDGGTVAGGVPSTVVDCTRQPLQILRAGAIPAGEILDVSDR
jgi:L-threonylcarbamoyladenylate synthase